MVGRVGVVGCPEGCTVIGAFVVGFMVGPGVTGACDVGVLVGRAEGFAVLGLFVGACVLTTGRRESVKLTPEVPGV